MLNNLCLLGVASAMTQHHHHHHKQPMHELVSLQSDPICGSGGCEETLPAPPKSHPVDYFVPNFGVDQDIKDNHNSLAIAEKQRGHKLFIENCKEEDGTKKPCNPALWTMYNFAPEQSDDVKDTANSISLAEEQIGHELTVQDVAFVDDKYTYKS